MFQLVRLGGLSDVPNPGSYRDCRTTNLDKLQNASDERDAFEDRRALAGQPIGYESEHRAKDDKCRRQN